VRLPFRFSFLFLAASLGTAQDLDQLKPAMLRFHPKLTEFNLVSTCKVDSAHSVVVIRGTVNLNRIEGQPSEPEFFRQEAFGVFVVDHAWKPLVELEVFPSKRWLDYDVKVDECGPDYGSVTGQGASYGDQRQRVLYFYDLKRRALVSRLPNDPISIEWIEPEGEDLYFIGPRVAARFRPGRPQESAVTPPRGSPRS
jgi:hypothetical protein